MSNCKLQALYFATTKFDVLDEFEGEKGTFIRSFLISDKLNLNDWEVTAEANRLDGPEFHGMPGIEFFNKGRRDHTVGNTYPEALHLQQPHAKAIIRKVLGAETGEKLEQISRVFDVKMIKFLKELKKSDKDMFVSPAIFPRSIEDVEIIERPDGTHIHRIKRYLPLHYAFVDEPAYGGDAKITDMCEGKDCLIKLAKKHSTDTAAIDGIGQDGIDPIRTIPIIRVSKCTKTRKISVAISGDAKLSDLVSECLSKKLSPGVEPTDQDIAICFSEARELLKSNNSQIAESKTIDKKMADTDFTKEKEDKLNARIADLEDKEKTRDEEAKKAKKAADEEKEKNKEESANENEDNDDKKDVAKKSKKGKKGNDEETEKEKSQSAVIASLTKRANMPIIEQYISARRLIGDSEDQLEITKTAMLKASVEDNESKLNEIKPFLAQLQFEQLEQESATKTIAYPYGMGTEQASGSTKSAEEMYDEVYS